MSEHNDETVDDVFAEKAFAEKARHRFDDSVQGLDAATRSALNQSRQVALKELGSRRPLRMTWLPAAGVAAAGVAALMLWTANPTLEQKAVPGAADIEILLTEDSLEMLEELEFYSWMELDEQAFVPPELQNHVG